MATHNRKLKMHEKLLYSVIQRQAGTIGKAILEGAMNSADAGSKDCHIYLTDTTLEIKDSGRGFKNLEEIDKFFDTFGQPHEESENKIYGAFRMGRGQLFAFGRNIWRTENFLMDVDFKNKGVDYTLSDQEKFVKGCQIQVELYKKLLPSELAEIKREVERYVKYMPMKVMFNGKRISVDLEKEKWDHVTPEGYVKLKRTGDLAVYNLGVYVKGYSNYNYGTGGIVVSKKQLKVNFARNDVMQSECPVWRKLRQFVNAKSTKDNVKRQTLNEDERKSLATKFMYNELQINDVLKAKLFTDVKGKHYSLDNLHKARRDRVMTFAPKYDGIGDKIHQQKLAFVLAEETLDRFECDAEKLIEVINVGMWDGWKYMPFSQLSTSFSERHDLIDPAEWTSYERLAIDMLNSVHSILSWRMSIEDNAVKERKALLGFSETSIAWTNGSNYIAYKRDWIKSKFQPLTVQNAMDVACVVLHEFCHDSADDTGHAHTQEFYENFHDNHRMIGICASHLIHGYEDALNRENRSVTKKFIKLQDKIIKNEDAVKQLNEQIKKSEESNRKFAAITEVKEQLKAPKRAKKKVAPKPKAKKKVKKQPDTVCPYSGKYGILYENAKQWIDRQTLLETVSEITGQTTEQVKMALSVLGNPNHRSNKGKTTREVDGNKIRIVQV